MHKSSVHHPTAAAEMAKLAKQGTTALPLAEGLEPLDPDLVTFITGDIVANAVRAGSLMLLFSTDESHRKWLVQKPIDIPRTSSIFQEQSYVTLPRTFTYTRVLLADFDALPCCP